MNILRVKWQEVSGRVSTWADMAELADALDLGSSGRPCRFDSCYPQSKRRMSLRRFFRKGRKLQ